MQAIDWAVLGVSYGLTLVLIWVVYNEARRDMIRRLEEYFGLEEQLLGALASYDGANRENASLQKRNEELMQEITDLHEYYGGQDG